MFQMLPIRSAMLIAAISVMGCLSTLTAQGAPGATDSHQMLATKQYLFVVHDGVLHQFDIRTLKLRKKTRLTGAQEMLEDEASAKKAAAAAKQAFDKTTSQPAPVAPSSADTQKSVELALTWLKTHQDKDGKWDTDGFMKHDRRGLEICNGPGNAVYDVGVTGLAIMALLSAGDDYAKEVRRAVSWLHKQQNKAGMFGTNASHDFIYNHAVATYAICRAMQVLGPQDALMTPMLAKAINYLEWHRNPYSVWRYQPRDNDNDMSVTTWCLLAYSAANDLGIKVNEGALKLGSVWMDQVTSPNGHAGYSRRGEPSSRKPGMHPTEFPYDQGEAMTAAALLARYHLKETPKTKPVMALAATLLLSKPPKWDVKAGTIDECYWFFGTLALQRAGGEEWVKWSKHLKAATSGHQRQKGNLAGSWDPLGVWAESGGRVFSTAMLALACQATIPRP
ncbi:MAG: hypothetical protein ACI89X_002393 [Planctomycetota bacterium]|jgi:hypothetical protein